MATLLIISSIAAITVSSLCSLAEALLLSLNPLTLNRLQTVHPRAAESWRHLKKNVARPITAILVLNTAAQTGGGTVAGGAFAQIYGQHNISIFSVIFTILVLFVTEISPKIIGVTFRNQLAPYAAPILEVITALMSPIIHVSDLLFRRFIPKEETDKITTADLITLATLARSGKAINLEQENIIVNTIRLSHTEILHAMIPPEKIRFIRMGEKPETILEMARQSGHTRYPVSSSIEVKDIFAYIVIKRAIPASSSEMLHLVVDAKPLHTVNRRDTLMTALRSMLQNKEHLLSVVDDHHRCVKIVTLEDIAGELLNADIEEFR